MSFFQWPCDLAFCKIWLNTFSKIFLVLCTKLIFRCQKFVDELLISKGITLVIIDKNENTYFKTKIFLRISIKKLEGRTSAKKSTSTFDQSVSYMVYF